MHNWTRCTKRWLYLRPLRPRRYTGCQATLLRNLGPMAVAVTAEFLDQLDRGFQDMADDIQALVRAPVLCCRQ